MARRQFRQSFQRSSRPNRGWGGTVPAAITAVPAASKALVAVFTLDNQGIDETILRVVGGVHVISDQVASSEDQFGAIGMMLATDTAVATGITALPDPVTDVSDDYWFFYQSFAQRFILLSSVGFEADAGRWYPFDSKAKRILESGHQVVLIAANANATHGFNISVNLRVLSQVRGTG